MVNIRKPDAWAAKILRQEAEGGAPKKIQIVLPTTARPKEKFRIRLALLDGKGFPSFSFEGNIKVIYDSKDGDCVDFCFQRGEICIAEAEGLAINEEGYYRAEAFLSDKKFYSNPVRIAKELKHNIFWGDPHIHTVLSNCHAVKCRSLNFCYTAGRYLSALDWVAAADHVSNGRCEKSKWKEQSIVCNLYNEPGSFATMPAYEASFKGGAGGDCNIYMDKHPGMFVEDYEGGTIKSVTEKLREQAECDFFTVPHHTTRKGKHGEISDEIYPGRSVMPLVEIASKWGVSEYRGNPNPLEEIHPGPSYVSDLLSNGFVMGFVGGTDTHSTMTFADISLESFRVAKMPGITAVIADKLERGELYNALKNRKCYAAAGERIYLDMNVSGLAQGSLNKPDDYMNRRLVSFTTAAGSDIESVEIIRNGNVMAYYPVKSWYFTSSFEDSQPFEEVCLESKYIGYFCYYYIRVNCVNGSQAWSSPVWFASND